MSCDCRLDWVYDLHRMTTQIAIKYDLEDIKCIPNPTKTLETPANLVCPYIERSNTFWEELNEQYKEYDRKEKDVINKTLLLAIPVEKLPCPEEFRPTPSTIKQEPSSSRLSVEQGKIMAVLLLALVLSVFLMF